MYTYMYKGVKYKASFICGEGEREREKERGREGGREGGRERERA